MRRLCYFVLFFVILLPNTIHAQESITCENGDTFTSVLRVLPPDVDSAQTEFIVTAMSIDNFDPIIGITSPDDLTICNAGAPDAELYEAQLTTVADVPPSPLSAQEFVLDPGQNTIDVGEFNGNGGTFLFVLEAFLDPAILATHSYSFTITDPMLQAGIVPTAYLFSMDEQYTPVLSLGIEAANGTSESVTAEPTEEPTLFTTLGQSFSAVYAVLPQMTGTVHLDVASEASAGFYALVLHLGSGAPAGNELLASIVENDDGSLSVLCDGELWSDNVLELLLPDDAAYTVTAIGAGDYDPVFAAFDTEDKGTCLDDSDAAFPYALQLPDVNLTRSPLSVQATIPAGGRLYLGSLEGQAGEVALVVEGGEVAFDDVGDTFALQITPGMLSAAAPVTAFAISEIDELNPALALVDDGGTVVMDADGLDIFCEDAGFADRCYDENQPLVDSTLALAGNRVLPGFELDAMLQIPLTGQSAGDNLRLRAETQSEASAGPYVFVLHLITD